MTSGITLYTFPLANTAACPSPNVKVKYAKLIVLNGEVTDKEVEKIQKYLINPVDQRLANLEKVDNLNEDKVEIEIYKNPYLKFFL